MIGLLFAGQGSQYVGMGQDLYNQYQSVKDVFDLYPNFRDLCFNGPKEILDDTKYAQPCTVLTSLAIVSLLKNIKVDFVAGLSLGEYSALAYSKAIKYQDIIPIVSKRGEIMQQALPKNTGMAAILNASRDMVKEVCQKFKIEVANYNAPNQIVITGYNDLIDQAILEFNRLGVKRCIKLNVSGAFHSSFLNEASKLLFNELSKYEIGNPKVKVVYNVYGTSSSEDVKTLLQKQIKSSVYFEETINYMLQNNVDTIIEVGPGAVLSGLVKKITDKIKVLNLNNQEDYQNILKEFKLYE